MALVPLGLLLVAIVYYRAGSQFFLPDWEQYRVEDGSCCVRTSTAGVTIGIPSVRRNCRTSRPVSACSRNARDSKLVPHFLHSSVARQVYR